MTQKEFQRRSKWQIVKDHVIYQFKKYRKYEWMIVVELPGTLYGEFPYLNKWHSATTIVVDTEAHAIYENLLNDQGEA